MRSIIFILIVITAVFTFLVIFAWSFQERIAFQPPGQFLPEPDDALRVTYSAVDNQPLFAYVVGDLKVPRGLLLSFHGNADLAVRQVEWGREVVTRTGFTVMLAEYRGYAGIGGTPGYRASQLDSEAAYLFAAKELRVPPGRIAFFGHSLGSAVATELAVRHQPCALLLQSPFTSAQAIARIIGWPPIDLIWGLISRIHFDTEAGVASLNSPVWVAHGAEDQLIPPRMGEQIFATARIKGELLIVPRATHNDVELAGGEIYWQWLSRALISSTLPESASGIVREKPATLSIIR